MKLARPPDRSVCRQSAEANTLTDAANRLCILTTVRGSSILARFEHLAGFKAFEHKGRRLMPTAAARIFYEEVLRMQARHRSTSTELPRRSVTSGEGMFRSRVFHRCHEPHGSQRSSASSPSLTRTFISPWSRARRKISSRRSTPSASTRGISLFESASETIDCREFMVMESVRAATNP